MKKIRTKTKLLTAIMILLIVVTAMGNTNGVLVSPKRLYPKSIRTPRDLEWWLTHNITYAKDEVWSDYWKRPAKTVADKKGDCEDFALLASKILKDLGYSTTLIGIYWTEKRIVKGKLKNVKTGHVICFFEWKNKPYYFTNNYYVRAKNYNILDIASSYYPKWEGVSLFNSWGWSYKNFYRKDKNK